MISKPTIPSIPLFPDQRRIPRRFGYAKPGATVLNEFRNEYNPEIDRATLPEQFLKEGGRYSYSYKAGAQINIFLDDNLVDEATFIQFDAQYPWIPIYGYASIFWDAVARGRVIVQGALAINFKYPGYLTAGIAKVGDMQTFALWDLAGKLQLGTSVDREAVKTAIETLVKMSPETLQAFQNISEAMGSASREDLASGGKPPLHRSGCTIKISYGDPSFPSEYPTSHVLGNVRLASAGQTVQITGEPIQEVYQFIARSLD